MSKQNVQTNVVTRPSFVNGQSEWSRSQSLKPAEYEELSYRRRDTAGVAVTRPPSSTKSQRGSRHAPDLSALESANFPGSAKSSAGVALRSPRSSGLHLKPEHRDKSYDHEGLPKP